MKSLGIVHDNSGVRKLIKENPDLPICVLVGQEVATSEFAYTYASDVSAELCEVLDCDTPTGHGLVYTDRDDLKEDFRDYFCDDYPDVSDAEYDDIIDKKLTEYDPYWKKCIAIRCWN